jgi:predicted nucleic acid-binding protein
LTEVFTDTGPLYAFFDVTHPRHADAVRLFRSSPPLVTTNLVVAEVVALAMARREPEFGVRVAERLIDGKPARIERVTPADEVLALRFLRRFAPMGANLTDCASFAVIARLQLAVVFSFDRHFAPPGFFRLEPPVD